MANSVEKQVSGGVSRRVFYDLEAPLICDRDQRISFLRYMIVLFRLELDASPGPPLRGRVRYRFMLSFSRKAFLRDG